MSTLTYPAAYATWLRGVAEHDGEQVAETDIAAEVAEQVGFALADAALDPKFPPANALIEMMGGTEYVSAVVAWREELALHTRKSMSLPAPAVPGH